MCPDITKTVIRIIQDYCFDSYAEILNDKFAMAIAPLITKHINNNNLDLSKLREIAKTRNDFFVANEIDFEEFCKGLFRKLNYELAFYTDVTFFDTMVIFKRKMENGVFRGFPRETTSEETLRSALVLFLQNETFSEPRSAAGNNDITVPTEKVIIETKLWNGIEYYNSGFPELNEYLDKYNYVVGYYVIFDYNQKDNPIIKDKGEIFDCIIDERLIHVIFIRMNPIRPSKIYKQLKSH